MGTNSNEIPGLDNEFPGSLPEDTSTLSNDIENTLDSSFIPDDQEVSNHSAPEHTPEYLQRKLYFLLEHLTKYHEDLPEAFQVRIPHEILSSLANCLLNDTIFEIVKGLMEIQHVTENHLSTMRDQIAMQHKSKKLKFFVEIMKKIFSSFYS